MPASRPQLLGFVGLAGSLFWLALHTALAPDWGPPGSGAYLGYETINRLWAPAFAAMLVGFLGFFARYPLPGRLGRASRVTIVGGLLAMLIGNVAEFWFLTDLPYGSLNARAMAWILVLLGILSLLSGCALVGWAGLRQNLWPAGVSAGLLLPLPVTIILMVPAAGIMFLMVFVVAALASGLALMGRRLPAPAAIAAD